MTELKDVYNITAREKVILEKALTLYLIQYTSILDRCGENAEISKEIEEALYLLEAIKKTPKKRGRKPNKKH